MLHKRTLKVQPAAVFPVCVRVRACESVFVREGTTQGRASATALASCPNVPGECVFVCACLSLSLCVAAHAPSPKVPGECFCGCVNVFVYLPLCLWWERGRGE